MSEIAEENLVEVFEKGTENNPYLISDIESFVSIRNNLSAHYRLITDIDFGGKAFSPMGIFTGVLDGAGYTISNLVQGVSANNAGLFNQANGATIKNLKIKGFTVSGRSYVGILAGSLNSSSVVNVEIEGTVKGSSYAGILVGSLSSSTVENVSVKGTVSNAGSYAGGLAGAASGRSIKCCKAVVTVNGNENVGGLLGKASGQIVVENSCVLGSVRASGSYSKYVAGLIAYADGATVKTSYASCSTGGKGKGLVYVYQSTRVENSYYDAQVAKAASNDSYNIGKLTASLIRQSNFKGWDFGGVWSIQEGESYPYLRNDEAEEFRTSSGEVVGGMGTEESPYLIGSKEGFNNIRYELGSHYRLISDIDFERTISGSMGTFTGVLDGAGYTISNLFQGVSTNNVGLFNQANGATIKNLKIKGFTVSGRSYVGILAGSLSSSSVVNVEIEGTVKGSSYAGILAGSLSSSTVENVLVKGTVSNAGSYAGGLAGAASGRSIKCCKAVVTVNGNENVGGLLGKASSQIVVENSCVLGSVRASGSYSKYVAGLIAYADGATVKTSYASCSTGGKGKGLVYVYRSTRVENSYFDSTVAGIAAPVEQAKTTEQLMQQDTFTNWDWDNIWLFDSGALPNLQGVEREPIELSVSDITPVTLKIQCPAFANIAYYLLTYGDKALKSDNVPIHIGGLQPETEYSFRIQVQFNNGLVLWSNPLKVTTKEGIGTCGLHSTEKGIDYIQLKWGPVPEAERYEIVCNEKSQEVTGNTVRLDNLQVETFYEIYVKAIFAGGASIRSRSIIEKIFMIDPKTEYSNMLIEKCEGQRWFIDELEILLNQKGKSINVLSSQNDLETIYAIDLRGRGFSGKIPAAIGELRRLYYLYLAGNDLVPEFPEEISLLSELKAFDLQ